MNLKTRKQMRRNKGITLIALVITIIVLLILVGVTIATLTGDNGILNKANDAKIQTGVGEEKEQIALAYHAAMIETNGEGVTADSLNTQFTINGTKATASEEETIKIEFVTGRSYTLDANGKIEEWVDISKYLEIGQYVDYNPTVTDKERKTKVEANKLTYTSPIGAGTSHGNGDSEQTFTAHSDIRWRILNIEDNGTVELISDNIIKTDDDANFVLNGAIGYLYAEQELNEICKIYGYGYGADTSKGVTYTTGGPLDTPTTAKIEGTGARSIAIEDINKKAGITEADYTTLNSSYGSTTNPTSNVFYPTVSTSTGKSGSVGVKNLKSTSYNYNKSEIENTDVQNMLFNGNYLLASRCIINYSGIAAFYVRYVNDNDTKVIYLCGGDSAHFDESTSSDYSVRPIITLKSNSINVSENYNQNTGWKLK